MKRLKSLSRKCRVFGFPVTFWHVLNSLKNRIRIFPEAINNKKNKVVNNCLAGLFQPFIDDYKAKMIRTQFQSQIPKKIWFCWWDGVDSMPLIVKACYNSVLQNAGDFKVTLITKDNFRDYMTIPDHIMEKVNSKIMTITHFSNIIRMSLLLNHGGLWIDATVLVTGSINIGNASFFTIKRNPGSDNVAKQRWTGNTLGGVPGIYLFSFIREFLFEYWKKYDFMVEHHLYDYSIALAYNSIPEIKELIDNVSLNNRNYMVLRNHLEDEYNKDSFDKIAEDTIFHKLTWKKKFSTSTLDNKLTVYGHILQKYSG